MQKLNFAYVFSENAKKIKKKLDVHSPPATGCLHAKFEIQAV